MRKKLSRRTGKKTDVVLGIEMEGKIKYYVQRREKKSVARLPKAGNDVES